MAKVKLVGVRLAFPDLFEAVQFNGEGEFRYGATFFLPKNGDAHKAVSAAIKEVAQETWKAKADAMIEDMKGNANKFCLTNGDAKTYEGAEGCMVLSARRKQKDGRPGIYDRDKSPLTAADGKIYSGCYVNATVDIWAQGKDFPGIRCTLIGVQFSHDGDAFSGSATVTPDDFDDLSDGSSAPDDLI